MKLKATFISKIVLLTICTYYTGTVLYAQDKQDLSLEKIWYSGEFSPKYPNSFKGMADGETYCLAERKDGYTEVWRYQIKDGKKLEMLFSTNGIKVNENPINMSSFSFSDDENKVIIKYNVNRIYRHSSTCDAIVYNLKSKEFNTLPNQIMYPTISPDGNHIAFVSDYNLHFMDLRNGNDGKVTDARKITNDGIKNKIRNGFVDWVYEEEFGMDVGFFWSPNSQYISYYKFNEVEVPEFTMDVYGSLYPRKETWKYPKAGEANSKVDIYIYSIVSGSSKKCETTSDADQYLPRMQWNLNSSYLAIQRLNRHQNKLDILKANPVTGATSILYTETNQYYIEIHDWIPNEAGDWLHLSEKSGYNHLWCLDGKSNKEKQITKGIFDIGEFYGYDDKKGMAYFNAGKDVATERQVFGANIKNGKLTQLTKGAGWHNATFIAGFNYFLDNHSTVSKPSVHTLFASNASEIRVLEDNSKLTEALAKYNLGETAFGKFKNRNGTDLDYWILKPANFDASKKYPVLFHVYGGPGYQTAKNSYGGSNYLWHQFMAQKGYIIITINNTGGGAQGEAFKKKTYLQLGNYETQDYIDAAKHFGGQSYVDASRIGIWGWSYGGYMSSNCITRGASYFKTAIAVAPVTSWRYYDNIYTERYMRTPQENAQGYDTNSPINHVKELKGNYLIVHGSADDNVHFQNALEMMMALNNNNVPYESAVYPNKNHGIYGGKTRLHLFTRMTKFILENL